MRYLIAIPCMDMVHTLFMSSLLAMRRPAGTEISICQSSLVYDSRNTIAQQAVDKGVDRVLWLDSDMVFESDLMERLIADMDEGRQFAAGLYFTRKAPIEPCFYRELQQFESGRTKAIPYTDYPRGTIFEVAGIGFGAAMCSVEALKLAGVESGPFSPIQGWGEDLSFAIKVREKGVKLYCDSRIIVKHIGQTLIDESTWRGKK